MITFGFRAQSEALNYAVVEVKDGTPHVLEDGTWKCPKTYEEAAGLTWIRDKVVDLIEKYKPAHAAVRYPEMSGQGGKSLGTYRRLRVEGVTLEVLNAHGVLVATGPGATIAAALGSKSAKNFKSYVENREFRGLDLSARPVERAEAILAAVSVNKE